MRQIKGSTRTFNALEEASRERYAVQCSLESGARRSSGAASREPRGPRNLNFLFLLLLQYPELLLGFVEGPTLWGKPLLRPVLAEHG